MDGRGEMGVVKDLPPNLTQGAHQQAGRRRSKIVRARAPPRAVAVSDDAERGE